MRLEPFKIVGQLIAAEKNDEGKIVGERVVGEIALYEPDFDKLPERVQAVWPEVEAQAS